MNKDLYHGDKEIIAHFGIDNNSILSLKQQLTDPESVVSGKMPAGTRLPSERVFGDTACQPAHDPVCTEDISKKEL